MGLPGYMDETLRNHKGTNTNTWELQPKLVWLHVEV